MTDHTVGPEIERLIQLLSKLPGLGPRSARRAALHLVKRKDQLLGPLAEAMAVARDNVMECSICGNIDTSSPCTICTDPRRDDSVICVVARVPDLAALEKSGTFRGRYHVLHGLLAPLDGVSPSDLPLDSLRERVKRLGTKELIVATPLSVEGEATALYVAEVFKEDDVTVSRIASGMPHGGELEFTDQVTLGRALDGRRTL
ncbi:MAG: recombination mediator RecR [Myxococcota bacterium]